MARRMAAWIGKALLAGCMAVGVLCLLALGYNYTGVHYTSVTGATDFVFPSHQIRSSMNEGFAWLRLDEDGFNNIVPPKGDGIDILLMGSSQMFATQVGARENAGYLLNALLSEDYTYNIGMGEHMFNTCMNNVHKAVEFYCPRKFVLMETNTVALSLEDMKKSCGGGYEELTSFDGGALFYLQRYVPFAKVLYRQVEDWKNLGTASKPPLQENYASDEYKALLRAYFDKTAAYVRDAGATLVIFYIPPTKLTEDGSLLFETDGEALAAFREGCEDAGIVFVDMTKDYKALYAQENKLPYGFANTRVGQGHLNRYGHRLIAERLAETINSLSDINPQ